MKVIVEIDDSVSREDVQDWIDKVLMPNPAVFGAHIACTGCTCEAKK